MPASPQRITVIASGLLCAVLTLVVLFTSPSAFRSPAAVVVMASIGTAAVLVQLRLRRDDHSRPVRPALWLNVLGILFALGALFPAALHIGSQLIQVMVFGAVGSFAISSAIILHSFRKPSAKSQ
jgi:uncharacterized membrane protein